MGCVQSFGFPGVPRTIRDHPTKRLGLEAGYAPGPDQTLQVCRSSKARLEVQAGVTFRDNGLAKQARAGKPRAEFFFLAFEDPLLCQKEKLRVFKEKTASLHSQNDVERTTLFLAVVTTQAG